MTTYKISTPDGRNITITMGDTIKICQRNSPEVCLTPQEDSKLREPLKRYIALLADGGAKVVVE